VEANRIIYGSKSGNESEDYLNKQKISIGPKYRRRLKEVANWCMHDKEVKNCIDK